MGMIYLARHGETEWNTTGRMQGHKDSFLTRKGMQQAMMLRNNIRTAMAHLPDSKRELDAAWSSCLGRAVKTAEICIENTGLSLTTHSALDEICLGSWEGLTFQEAERVSPIQFFNFWHRPSRYIPTDGGETFEQVQERMVLAITDILKTYTHRHVLVVSHWIAIKTALAYFMDMRLDDIPYIPKIINGSYCIISMKDGKPSVKYHNTCT